MKTQLHTQFFTFSSTIIEPIDWVILDDSSTVPKSEVIMDRASLSIALSHNIARPRVTSKCVPAGRWPDRLVKFQSQSAESLQNRIMQFRRLLFAESERFATHGRREIKLGLGFFGGTRHLNLLYRQNCWFFIYFLEYVLKNFWMLSVNRAETRTNAQSVGGSSFSPPGQSRNQGSQSPIWKV